MNSITGNSIKTQDLLSLKINYGFNCELINGTRFRINDIKGKTADKVSCILK